MNGRDLAFIAAGGFAFAAFVGLGAFAISSLAPSEVRLASNVPSLTVAMTPAARSQPPERADAAAPAGQSAAPQLFSQAPPAERAARSTPTYDLSPATTGSLKLSAVEPLAAPRPARAGTEAIIRQRLNEAPPDVSPERRRRPAVQQQDQAFEGASNRASGGFRPGLVPPVPPLAARAPPTPRYAGVLTSAEITRMRQALRLTPDQEGYWPPVETILREIGGQQMALARAGRRPEEAFNSGITGRLYWAARPLLARLREDQKVEVRKRARLMGFESVASMI